MCLFSGKDGRLWPAHNMAALSSRSFKTAGKILAHSIIQSYVGFPFLSESVYAHMSSSNDEEVMGLITTEDIPEGENKEVILTVIQLR